MMRFSFKNINYAMTGELLSKGMPKATRRICNVFRPMIINHTVITIGGTIAMSALSVQHSSADFLELLGTCLADVIVLMCGIYYGERNREGITDTLSMSFRYIITERIMKKIHEYSKKGSFKTPFLNLNNINFTATY